MFKALAKPAFLRMLQVRARADLLLRRPAGMHGLSFRIVISITSYPARFRTLLPTLMSLLAQSVRADNIVLWIAEKDMASVPRAVLALRSYGLDIRETFDLRSYKKIIPTLSAFPDAAILTADDDVYYPRQWLARFVDSFNPEVREVLCHRAHRLRREGNGLAPYRSWEFEVSETKPVSNLFATGVGGIFYPPGIFYKDVDRIDRLMELCPTTDDVWLNWMARLSGATIRKVGPKQRFYEWPGSQKSALLTQNYLEGNSNDEQLARMIKAYGIPEAIQ